MSKAIHINGVEYPYKVSSVGVKIQLPNNKKHYVDMSTLTGWTWNALERVKWKGGLGPAVTPSDIKEYIIINKLYEVNK